MAAARNRTSRLQMVDKSFLSSVSIANLPYLEPVILTTILQIADSISFVWRQPALRVVRGALEQLVNVSREVGIEEIEPASLPPIRLLGLCDPISKR